MGRGRKALVVSAVGIALLPSISADTVDPNADPVAFLSQLAELPEQQQDDVLYTVGHVIQRQNPNITCNIFAGTEACVDIPQTSVLGTACMAARPAMNVDCVYAERALADQGIDPVDRLAAVMGGDFVQLKQHCPQCLTNLQTFWCLEILPDCGSFQQTVHRAILPAILDIKASEDAGQPQEVALAEAVPGLLEAMAQSFSCREMCQAVVDTCSCKAVPGESLTFGEALTAAQENNDNFQQFHPGVGTEQLGTIIFKDIWDQPLCNIFTPKDNSTFVGDCDLEVITANAQCSDNDFCADLAEDKRVTVEAVIAGQIARAVFGVTSGSAGLRAQDDALPEAVTNPVAPQTTPPPRAPAPVPPPPAPLLPPVPDPITPSQPADTSAGATVALEPDTSPSSDGKQGWSAAGYFFFVAFMAALLGSAGFFAWKWHQRRQFAAGFAQPSDYDAIHDDGIPLQ